MWCNAHPNTWQDMNNNSDAIPWMIERIKEHKSRIVRENLKDAKDICGIVDFPLWDFIQPSHYIFPQLHIEIGLVNNILESFNDFVEEQVEVAPPEERLARNNMIMSDVAFIKAKQKVDEWKDSGGADLAMQRYS